MELIMKVIGKSIQRVDALGKVTGETQYPGDINLPNQTYMKILFAGRPHAIIHSIDTSQADALPGVIATFTAKDVPVNEYGLIMNDQPVLCGPGSSKPYADRVRFIGDQVALVIAETEDIAARGRDLIKVEYEDLPGIFDPEYGASPEAPVLHPDLGTYEVANFIFPQPGSNISNHFRIRKGDVDSAWPDCAVVVEHKYRIPHVQHVPIEPHVATARVEENGRIILWGSSQSPFAQRNLIAKTLGVSPSDVQVIAPYVGGGFGCKAGVSMEALAGAIAMKV
jgi:CO/xanthine dehydrogenase Mo-binding subunit